MERGYLSDRQIAFIRKTIKKYIGQLLAIGCSPVSLSPFVKTEGKKIESVMSASLLVNNAQNPTGIQVQFSFPRGDNRFGEVLAKIKTLPGRRFIKEDKCWKVPLSLEAGQKLKEWRFEFSEGLQKWHDSLTGVKDYQSINIEGLLPFQKEGVGFIESRNGSALIADEQGLGKTIQALGYLEIHPEIRPILIVVPASVKINWQREALKWVSENNKIHILSGKNPYSLPKADIYIINYDILGDAKWNEKKKEYELKGWVPSLINCKFKLIIGDEIQRIKSSSAQRSRAMMYLSKHIAKRQALSGTPIKNKAIEFFNSINFVNPQLFPNYWNFGEEFANKVYNHFSTSGFSFEGSRNADKLHRILKETIMIRRLKEEVLKDLPPKIRAVVPMEIVNQKVYDEKMDEFKKWIEGTYTTKNGTIKSNEENPAAPMVLLEKMRQATLLGKIDACIEWIEDFIESGKKLIVFATHIETLNILQKKFKNISVRVDGGTKDRQSQVDAFWNDDKIQLFLGNIIAAGEGLNLQIASDVAFIEYTFVPTDHVQAEDRAHRINQKDNVTAWYLVAANTVEEKLVEILNDKAKILDQILDGKDVNEESVFSEIVKYFKVKGGEK